MPGVGTLIDMSGIVAGGMTAIAFGRLFSEKMKEMMRTSTERRKLFDK